MIDSTYEEVPGLWSKRSLASGGRDLLSKPSLSQKRFGEEGQVATEPAEQRKQGVGGGFVSRRKPMATGADTATADRADAVADADARFTNLPPIQTDGSAKVKTAAIDLSPATKRKRFGTDPKSEYQRKLMVVSERASSSAAMPEATEVDQNRSGTDP